MTRRSLVQVIDTGGPGGAETVFCRLVAGLAARRWQGPVIVSREGWLAEQLRSAGHEPMIVPSRGSLQFGLLNKLVEARRQSGARVFLTHLYGSAIYGSAAGLVTSRPVVGVFHGQTDLAQSGRFDRIKRGLVRHGMTRAVAVSTSLRDMLDKHFDLGASRWSVIANGIDIAAFLGQQGMGLRNRLGLDRQAVLVGALGNIRKPKGYDDLLRAAAQVIAERKDVHFLVAGEGKGALRDELLGLRGSLGLEAHVHFIGPVDDAPAYLTDLDVFVSSSTSEGFSIACTEAMASALPVVATRSGGPDDIVVDGVTGVLVPISHPEELSAAILQLCGDPGMREAYGEAGRRRARERYALDAMVDAYEALLESVTGA